LQAYLLFEDFIAVRPEVVSETLTGLSLITDTRQGTAFTLDSVRRVVTVEMLASRSDRDRGLRT
jgi:hypothetical protein